MKDFFDKQLKAFCQGLTDCQKAAFKKIASKSQAQTSLPKPVKLKIKNSAMFGELPSLLPTATNVAQKH